MPPVILYQEACQILAKLKMRIVIAMSAAKYFEIIGCPLTTANMQWSVLKKFDEQLNAIKERKDVNKAVAPTFIKGISIHKCIESMYLYLRAIVGVRNVPL